MRFWFSEKSTCLHEKKKKRKPVFYAGFQPTWMVYKIKTHSFLYDADPNIETNIHIYVIIQLGLPNFWQILSSNYDANMI